MTKELELTGEQKVFIARGTYFQRFILSAMLEQDSLLAGALVEQAMLSPELREEVLRHAQKLREAGRLPVQKAKDR